MISHAFFLALSLSATVLAKTDLTGCTSSNVVVNGGASVLWYVPSNGEICEALDCGGGRAPPKTTVPGCAAYSGTATYSPSFIAGYGGPAQASATPAGGPATSSPVQSVYTSAYAQPTSRSVAWSSGGILTDTSTPSFTSTLVTITTAFSGDLVDTTSTLQALASGSLTSVLPSSLVFDTSAVDSVATTATTINSITSTRASRTSSSSSVAQVTANAAVHQFDRRQGALLAAVGAAAGLMVV